MGRPIRLKFSEKKVEESESEKKVDQSESENEPEDMTEDQTAES